MRVFGKPVFNVRDTFVDVILDVELSNQEAKFELTSPLIYVIYSFIGGFTGITQILLYDNGVATDFIFTEIEYKQIVDFIKSNGITKEVIGKIKETHKHD